VAAPVVVDRSDWGRIRVTGDDRVRFLQGVTTVNIEALADGAHAWGAMLSPKGRVLSIVQATVAGDSVVLACEPSLTDKTRGLLDKYAVMDDVTFEPLVGPAHQVWVDAASVWTSPVLGVAGDGARPADDLAVELLRIRGGFLRYGADVDEDHFPFETPIGQFLDYEKGCYIGQEPVFRVHAQGNTARTLRGLEIDGGAPVADGTALDAPAKGVVTSSVAAGDRVIALAYCHRTSWEPGATVTVGGRTATIRELPF
jgi:folate-binding protein YgfZ